MYWQMSQAANNALRVLLLNPFNTEKKKNGPTEIYENFATRFRAILISLLSYQEQVCDIQPVSVSK